MNLRAARLEILPLVLGLLIVAAAAQAQPGPSGKESACRENHAYMLNSVCRNCHINEQVGGKDFLGNSTIHGWNDVKHDHAFHLLYREKVDAESLKEDSDPDAPIPERELVTRILGFKFASVFNHKPGKFRSFSKDAPKEHVDKVRLCLNCHASETRESDEHIPLVPFAQGVSCQACHGPGTDWFEAHQQPWWRRVTHSAKCSKGFVDVRNAEARARMCASCHVGNLEEGKFVTHDWYAKGHPPLPSFEYSTFAAAMPVHWRPVSEKAKFRGRNNGDDKEMQSDELPTIESFREKYGFETEDTKDSYHEATFDTAPGKAHTRYDDLPRLRDTVISGVAVLDMYAKLVEDYSLFKQGKLRTPHQLQLAEPEFALYDCGSCHHELRSGKRYPFRPFGKGLVGRPPAYTWPAALVKVGVWQGDGFKPELATGNWKAFVDSQTKFERAVTEPIFGDPTTMKPAATAFRVELTKLTNRLKKADFDQAAARESLKLLTNVDEVETRDFHSARQVAWAIREITKDCQGMPYRTENLSAAQAAAIGQLFSANVFHLDLPAHAKASIVENNSSLLPGIGKFEAESFETRLRELQRLCDQP